MPKTKTCFKCGCEFPFRVEIGGKVRNLKSRKYCLNCSPFGLHNTRQIEKPPKPKSKKIRDTVKSEYLPDIKKCVTCKEIKKLSQFYRRRKTSEKRQSSCKACCRIRNRQYERQYSKARNQRRNKVRAKARKRNQRFVFNYLLKHPCVDCGESDPIVLEFDHQRDKIDNISGFVRHGVALRRLSEEIDKCEVRCANCHRRKTANERGWARTGMVEQPQSKNSY